MESLGAMTGIPPVERGLPDRTPGRTLDVFSVDVEDYFQVSAFEGAFPRERWDSVPLRLDRGVHRLLELTADAQVHGTFYVLGWLARRRPDLVRAIAAAGHEIGCHSDEHRLVYSMTPKQFREDLRTALAALQDASGRDCTLYRAPSFSVTRASLWALEILADEGIRVDSSIFPVRHDRYGLPGAPSGPFRPLADRPEFLEFPPSTVKFLRWTLPCAGGGYFRLYPLPWTCAAIRRIHRTERRPAMVYVHPWELDPDQPIVSTSLITRFRHRVNLGSTATRLAALFSRFDFAPLSRVVEQLGGPRAFPFVDPGKG